MINTYRATIETATTAQLRELIEHNSMDNVELDDYALMDDEELRAGIYTNLESDGLWLETVEDDILDSFANGSYTEGAKQMDRECINIYNLIDYIEDYNEMVGYGKFSFVDLRTIASIMDSLRDVRREDNA